MKHLLIAMYIFSVLYCYLQLNTMIERCIKLFKERHPLIQMDEPSRWNGFKLEVKILGVSAIPVVNLFLGYFISTLDESVISEIVRNVETKHWQEIREAEEELSKKLNNLDMYF